MRTTWTIATKLRTLYIVTKSILHSATDTYSIIPKFHTLSIFGPTLPVVPTLSHRFFTTEEPGLGEILLKVNKLLKSPIRVHHWRWKRNETSETTWKSTLLLVSSTVLKHKPVEAQSYTLPQYMVQGRVQGCSYTGFFKKGFHLVSRTRPVKSGTRD